jgi:hypothetical protein
MIGFENVGSLSFISNKERREVGESTLMHALRWILLNRFKYADIKDFDFMRTIQ